MLFGRGSTGGAVNQVSKTPYLENASEVNLSAGNFNYVRATGDFNIQTADDAALRITAMKTQADNNGAGSSVDKQGIAGAYRWRIGEKMEHQVSFYHLENNNGINYGLPWMKPHASDSTSANTVNDKLDPSNYYGMSSDYNDTKGDILSYTNTLRLGGGAELKSVLRHGEFSRDLRASTIRLNDSSSDLSNFSDSTTYRRGSNVKIQKMALTQAQIDYTAKHEWFGLKHSIASGFDFSHEKRKVYTASAVTKPTTTAGTPDDGAWIDEDARTTPMSNRFSTRGMGVYLQDLMQVAPHWKVLGGLRYDMMKGNYQTYNTTTGAPNLHYEQNIYEWSKRVGLLFQPTALQSYHFSYGTSFNTSGDTYSYSALSANTPPESSENIELGTKLDSEDGRVTTRVALFRATKNNERNTDTDTSATAYLLSGKRHAAGIDMDVIGQITDEWEVYASYTWIPEARVDKAAPTASTVGNREGDRPGMTPVHSGTVWNTYRFLPQFRAGLGVNFRSKESPADLPGGYTYTAPGYATVDLMGEYTFSPKYILKANVTNLANKLYGDQLYRGHYVPGAGRLVQFTLTAKF
jgi:catecholate siderophore receptor